MSFALCPKDGPPRLLRFTTLERPYLALLDNKNNVLRIDKDSFDLLTRTAQEEVIRTQADLLCEIMGA